MERADLLELLYSARDRSQTIRATVTRWSNEARLREHLRGRGEYRDPTAIRAHEENWGRTAEAKEIGRRLAEAELG